MGYKEYPLEALLIYEQPTAYIVNSTDYRDEYSIPVLTAGKSFILGYTNEKNGVFDKLPVIIFDDFTTATQYVDFRFKVKSSAMKILHINTDLVLPKYIYYRLQIIQLDHSTHKRYWIQQYSKIRISIPTLKEQARIVSYIEEMLSELEAGIKTLEMTRKQIEVYRQSVLKEAFDSVFLESIKSEIDQVCSNIVDCPHSTPEWVDKGHICLRTTNFKRGYLDLSEMNFVSKKTFDDRNTRLVPKPGDILYSREGAILGIACIIPAGLNVCLGQRMMLLRTSEKMINKYLMHYLNSPRLTNYVTSITGGSASPHVNVGDIKKFIVPVPTLETQREIVNYIDEKLTECENIEKTINRSLQEAMALRQSILKESFERR